MLAHMGLMSLKIKAPKKMLAQSYYTKKSDIKGNRCACLWFLNQTRDILYL